MAPHEIIQTTLDGLGQSQTERAAPELDVHFADVDERSSRDLLVAMKRLAPLVRFHDRQVPTGAGGWPSFFPFSESEAASIIAAADGTTPPHLALMLAFIELYHEPRALINTITGRHLAFQFSDVLRFTPRAAVSDRAHVVLELRKGAPPTAIGPEHLLSAGKDATGVERLYAPTGTTVIGGSRVESLRSIHLDRAGGGRIRHAPIANSANGLGAELEAAAPSWPPFGDATLPAAEIGFAVASPLLAMREGARTATITLELGTAVAGDVSSAFRVFLTGEKGWFEPSGLTATSVGTTLTLAISLSASEQAVVALDAKLHGSAFAAAAPVAQIVLRTDGSSGYGSFGGIIVESVAVAVEVSGIRSLTLESDAGTLDPRKAFQPFGPQPSAGSRFMIGYPEALAKRLSTFSIALTWKDTPASGFHSHYAGYAEASRITGDAYFTADVRLTDASGTEMQASAQPLFGHDGTAVGLIEVDRNGTSAAPATPWLLYALLTSGSSWATQYAMQTILAFPLFFGASGPPAASREGFITLTLNEDFLHASYRKQYVEKVLAFTKSESTTITLLNEPYTPTVREITLAYTAESGAVPVSSTSQADFANPDAQFFHVGAFGAMREHGYQRQQLPFVTGTSVTLLPEYASAGELLIGLGGVGPGDGVSLLVQVAEGSADPSLSREAIAWSVLSDNYWRALADRDIALDTTGSFLRSGIVRIAIPTEATTTNTLLPAGLIWLRATVAGNVASVGRLLDIRANAIETVFVDRDNDPLHLESALPAGSIAKLRDGHASVKSVEQPYASFGGRPVETAAAMTTRASERLRHKNRCVTPWDYERIVLEAFPSVHRVKCVPHAREGSWLAPGHVMLVVVPDLRNRNAVDPLEPRVDADTIESIREHVAARAAMGVTVTVKNPSYQKIRLDFTVRFHAGREFNYHRAALEQAIVEMLSPWAYGGERPPGFGGAIHRSVLLDFVEELEYVDYVTDFRMLSYTGETIVPTDLDTARAATPDTILVSDATHTIAEA